MRTVRSGMLHVCGSQIHLLMSSLDEHDSRPYFEISIEFRKILTSRQPCRSPFFLLKNEFWEILQSRKKRALATLQLLAGQTVFRRDGCHGQSLHIRTSFSKAGANLGSIWDQIWVRFGTKSGSNLGPNLGPILDQIWVQFGIKSGSNFGPKSGPISGQK